MSDFSIAVDIMTYMRLACCKSSDSTESPVEAGEYPLLFELNHGIAGSQSANSRIWDVGVFSSHDGWLHRDGSQVSRKFRWVCRRLTGSPRTPAEITNAISRS